MVAETFEKIVGQLNEFWENKDSKTRWLLISGALLLVAALAVAIILMSRTNYAVLYRDLDPREAGEIMTRLEDMNIDVKARDTRTIMVPAEQVDTLIMQLASEGYPKTGFNYDIFQSGATFTTTESDKQTLRQFQLQERLQTSFKYLEPVDDAIVTIYIPDRVTTFTTTREEASASVILMLKPGTVLGTEQVMAIESAITRSVPGLLPENVSIIDNNMKVYDSQSTGVGAASTQQLDVVNQAKQQMDKYLLERLTRIWGPDDVITGVNVVIDFDARKTTSETVAPPIDGSDTGIPISENIMTESTSNVGTGAEAGQNPNGVVPQYPAAGGTTGTHESRSVTTNYELNKTIAIVESAGGRVEDLTVSVVLNREEMDDVTRTDAQEIVANMMGITTDKVVVKNMLFDTTISDAFQEAQTRRIAADRTMYLTRIAIIAVFALILLLAIILAYRVLKKKQRSEDIEAIGSILDETAQQPDMEYTNFDELKRNTYKEQIEEFIERSPDLVAHLLRNWISED